MTVCRNPECARLRAEIRTALVKAEAEVAERRRLTTLGGPPPPLTQTWENRLIPGALHADSAHLAADTGRSSKGIRGGHL